MVRAIVENTGAVMGRRIECLVATSSILLGSSKAFRVDCVDGEPTKVNELVPTFPISADHDAGHSLIAPSRHVEFGSLLIRTTKLHVVECRSRHVIADEMWRDMPRQSP